MYLIIHTIAHSHVIDLEERPQPPKAPKRIHCQMYYFYSILKSLSSLWLSVRDSRGQKYHCFTMINIHHFSFNNLLVK